MRVRIINAQYAKRYRISYFLSVEMRHRFQNLFYQQIFIEIHLSKSNHVFVFEEFAFIAELQSHALKEKKIG